MPTPTKTLHDVADEVAQLVNTRWTTPEIQEFFRLLFRDSPQAKDVLIQNMHSLMSGEDAETMVEEAFEDGYEHGRAQGYHEGKSHVLDPRRRRN